MITVLDSNQQLKEKLQPILREEAEIAVAALEKVKSTDNVPAELVQPGVGAPIAQWVKHRPTDLAVPGSSHHSWRRESFRRKRGSTAHSLSLSPYRRPYMNQILFKRTQNRKSSIHQPGGEIMTA